MAHQISTRMTRRSFCALSAVALASLGLPSRAFADASTPPVTPGSIIIIHTNDVHCAVDENLSYAKLADFVKATLAANNNENVTLVDAGDAVQGRAIGTLSQGEYLIDIMNECGYDVAIPGNHEFDFGMEQFNTLVARANAQYLSCNFTDLRTNNLMFDAYTIREYTTNAGLKRVAFVGICTPSTLTSSSPTHFQDSFGNKIFGFCEDETGQALYQAVQTAVDNARTTGKADYVVALAHLGQDGGTTCWRSDTVAANTFGIDVIIDGHSHEEYVQTIRNANGEDVLITQAGSQLAAMGMVTINPATNSLTATTPTCVDTLVKAWDGSDAATAAVIQQKQDALAAITGQVIGQSQVRLITTESDNYTWAIGQRETNLGDFVADAYRALAWHNGVMADVALVNSGGIRASIEPGDITYGNLLDVQPFNNQLCYVRTRGQNILDALEAGAQKLPEPSGAFQHAAGLSFTIRTDIPSSVQIVDGAFAGVTGEYRVRDVLVDGEPLDVNKEYILVSHTFLITDGGDGLTMFKNDEAVLLDLDNVALIEYLQYDLNGVIGDEYANEAGQGRILIKDGPDVNPTPGPDPETNTDSENAGPSDTEANPLAATSDTTTAAASVIAAGAAAALGAMGVAAISDKLAIGDK